MALGWDPVALAQIEGGAVRPAILLRIATDPVIRLWVGAVRDLALPADNIETTEGAIYQSMGLLTELPVFAALLNGQAERVEFGLSGAGVTGEIAAIASTEAGDIRRVAVNVGWFAFDSQWRKITPVDWRWQGTADSLSIDRRGDAINATRVIRLSAGSIFTWRRRPAIAYFTDPDQRRRSADDAFLSEVRRYSAQSTKVWPV